MQDFLEKVSVGVQKCCGDCFQSSVLLAVSGGIDSMVMLYALKNLCCAPNAALRPRLRLSVVTVNHNIRRAETSAADTLFVKNQCRILNLPCTVKTIPVGAVAGAAVQRGGGTEDAARFMRYALLEEQAKKEGCDFVFLAHNRDDQLETLLQRFFQGATGGISGTAAAGILRRRGVFCRPLLDIPRLQISAYARLMSVPFCEDETNADTAYYRNNLRRHLIPFLNEHVKGWDTGVLSGAEKAKKEAAFIEKLSSALVWEPLRFEGRSEQACAFTVRTDAGAFFKAGFPVRIRSLYAATKKVGLARRIPYAVLEACASGQRRVKGGGIECFVTKRFLYVKNVHVKMEEKQRDFCLQLDHVGVYDLPFGSFEIVFDCEAHMRKTQKNADNKHRGLSVGPFCLPLRIRSRRAADRIKMADGAHKSLKKLWNEWGVEPPHVPFVPVIEYRGEPVCVWGALFGYPNWYVKGCAVAKNCTAAQPAVYFCFVR